MAAAVTADVAALRALLAGIAGRHGEAAAAGEKVDVVKKLDAMSKSVISKLAKQVDDVASSTAESASAALALAAEPVDRALVASNKKLRARVEEIEDDVSAARARVLKKSEANLGERLRVATEAAQHQAPAAAGGDDVATQRFAEDIESKFDEIATATGAVRLRVRSVLKRNAAVVKKGEGLIAAAEQVRGGAKSRKSGTPSRSTVSAQARTTRKQRPY